MGDLVLTEDEVNPVMSAVLDNGLDVTALHNHFFWETAAHLLHARAWHGHGGGPCEAHRAGGRSDRSARSARGRAGCRRRAVAPPTLDSPHWRKIIGHQGEQNGAVYKITIGRPDLNVREQGA